MAWDLLSFLAERWFVLAWYVSGVLSLVYVVDDIRRTNTPLKKAMQWAWPIIVLFFSVVGLLLYFTTARAPGIESERSDAQKQRAHDAFERNMFRRVNGAVIHCVAGDGLGIMTAMVIARSVGLTFWQEFWFEYAAGFAFGWLIFQWKSMRGMSGGALRALAMAFRAEFFSMITVMAGMGAVMTFVTPAVVTAQPKPLTFAFWGFGMFGLLVGYVLTFPMNWMLVKIGWKHGMGSAEGARPVTDPRAEAGLFAAMVGLGLAALALPAVLTVMRETRPVAELPTPSGTGPQLLQAGLATSLDTALQGLEAGDRGRATLAIDAAHRASEVGSLALGGPATPVRGRILEAKRALQQGEPADARAKLLEAGKGLDELGARPPRIPVAAEDYGGVPLLNAEGVRIGRVSRVAQGRAELLLGGAQDLWGFLDLGTPQQVVVPVDALLFGPRRTLGKSWAMLPTFARPPLPPHELLPGTPERPAARRPTGR